MLTGCFVVCSLLDTFAVPPFFTHASILSSLKTHLRSLGYGTIRSTRVYDAGSKPFPARTMSASLELRMVEEETVTSCMASDLFAHAYDNIGKAVVVVLQFPCSLLSS
jgi:hypothetical protein